MIGGAQAPARLYERTLCAKDPPEWRVFYARQIAGNDQGIPSMSG